MTAAQEAPAPEPDPPLHEDRLDYTPTARSVTLARRMDRPPGRRVGAPPPRG